MVIAGFAAPYVLDIGLACTATGALTTFNTPSVTLVEYPSPVVNAPVIAHVVPALSVVLVPTALRLTAVIAAPNVSAP